MDATLAAVTEFSANTTFGELPEEVVERALGIVVDTLGCLTGGRDYLAVSEATALTSDEVRALEWGVVVGMPGNYPVELAAFLNTTMIRCLDFNDHLIAGHASDMIGALLAVACRPGRPSAGTDLLTAIVVAYEVHARVVRIQWMNQSLDRTWSIAIGATAGVCNLLGLSADATRNALSMATTASVALRASRSGALSDFKATASSVSAKFGVFYALLGEAGLTGPEAPFEGRHGARELFEGEPGPIHLDPFDSEWKVLETCNKYWPVAYGIQPAIWTAIELRDLVPIDEVETVVLHAAPFGWHESGHERERWVPTTRESADHSMPYAFARAYETGTVDGEAFLPSAFQNPDTLSFMERITVEPDWDRGPKISDIVGTRTVLTTKSGEQHTVNVDDPIGHHRNPMTRDQINAKARKLIEPVLGDRTEAALDAAWSLKSAPNIDALLAAFLPS
jgi:2-methylcitrate dehydratase